MQGIMELSTKMTQPIYARTNKVQVSECDLSLMFDKYNEAEDLDIPSEAKDATELDLSTLLGAR